MIVTMLAAHWITVQVDFMIAEVARLLKENKVKLPFGLYIVNAVQEEIGLRGAEMIAHKIKPNVAIVTDVTHDTKPR
jgi:putative aminopeptidase FrvX